MPSEKKLTYQAEKFEGKSERVIAKRKEGGGFTYERKADTRVLYDVYFPRGHSVRVSEDELKRMNLDGKARLIDLETGDESAVPDMADFSPKAIVRNTTRERQRSGFSAA